MINISANIKAPLSEIWEKWVSVEGVQHWAFASDDWAAEGIENNVKPGGSFKNRNFAKDGSVEFFLEGTYEDVDPQKHVSYTMGDGRKVETTFEETSDGVNMRQFFEPETEKPRKNAASWLASLSR